MVTMAIEATVTLPIPMDGRSMLEATRQVSQFTIPGRTTILATGITGRLAVAMWEASAVTGEASAVTVEASAVTGEASAVVTAAAGIADRNR
jgi:hypothetical protein